MEEEFNLSDKIKYLFEIEYLDTMSDVQGDIHLLLKEFIRLLNTQIQYLKDDKGKDVKLEIRNKIAKEVHKLAGEKLIN
ncbi:MAG: hypothetical protein AABY22_04470 [Nanoarchaeota archaeon]